MEVYVFFTQTVTDTEESSSIEVFASKVKAKKKFDEKIAKEKNHALQDGWEIEECEDSFEAWEDGCYVENHVKISINELTVQ